MKQTDSLCLAYKQSGRKKTSGALSATQICGDEKQLLLIDTLDIAFEALRRRFIKRLYDTGLSQDLFPAEVLIQNLLEMTEDALVWGEPKVKENYTRFEFERLIAYHATQYPDISPCKITRMIQAKRKVTL